MITKNKDVSERQAKINRFFDRLIRQVFKPQKRSVIICRDKDWYCIIWDTDAVSTTNCCSSLAQVAEGLRTEAKKLVEKYKDINDALFISFTPPADIVWQSYKGKPDRFFTLSTKEQDEFWRVFTQGLEDFKSPTPFKKVA